MFYFAGPIEFNPPWWFILLFWGIILTLIIAVVMVMLVIRKWYYLKYPGKPMLTKKRKRILTLVFLLLAIFIGVYAWYENQDSKRFNARAKEFYACQQSVPKPEKFGEPYRQYQAKLNACYQILNRPLWWWQKED